MGKRRKDRPDPVPRRDFASFRYDRHDAGPEAWTGRAALQAILQFGLEAIDEDAGRAEAGEFERRRSARPKQRAQRQAFEIKPDRRGVLAEISGAHFESGRPERIEQFRSGLRWTCRRLGAFGSRRAKYRCRTKGPECVSPSTPWPLVRAMENREALLKRCLPSTDTATTAPSRAGSCCSGFRMSASGTFAERPIQPGDLEIQEGRERHPANRAAEARPPRPINGRPRT
jgi:hypothetical protein